MRDERGFTLIELLVVILVIGILAAIALPTFLHQDEKAADAGAKADARNAVTAVESCLAAATTKDVASACAPSAIDDLPDSAAFSSDVDGDGLYAVTATSSTGTTFTLTKTGPSKFSRSCTGQTGGCKAGSW